MATLPENLTRLIPRPEKEISCQHLLQMRNVAKNGFLRKMADSWSGRMLNAVLNLKWSSKFVVIHSGCVYIYGHETSQCYERAYSLFGFHDVQVCENDVYKAGNWVFKVLDALQDQDKGRSLMFAANSADDMKKWIDCFQEEIRKANVTMYSSPVTNQTKPAMRQGTFTEGKMPQLTEAVKNEMRESMRAADINILHETGSSSSDEIYTDIIEENVTIRDVTENVSKPSQSSESTIPSSNTVKNSKSTCSNGRQSQRPKPQPPPKREPPPALSKISLKPMLSVKPMPSLPGNKTIEVQNRETKELPFSGRQVPKPPPFNKTSQNISNVPGTCSEQKESDNSSGGYEGCCEYVASYYEQWEPKDNSLSDVLVKAAYWQKEPDQAQKLMSSIKEEGVFLIRDAADGVDYKTMMVCIEEDGTKIVRKYKILKDGSNLFSISPGQSGFKSLQELLQYYQKNTLPNKQTKLTKPYSEVVNKTKNE